MKSKLEELEHEMEQANQLQQELINVSTKYAEKGLDPFLIKCVLLEGVMHILLKAHSDGVLTEAHHDSYESAASTYLDEFVSEWCDDNQEKIDRIMDIQRN
jgi:hypothetical protein